MTKDGMTIKPVREFFLDDTVYTKIHSDTHLDIDKNLSKWLRLGIGQVLHQQVFPDFRPPPPLHQHHYRHDICIMKTLTPYEEILHKYLSYVCSAPAHIIQIQGVHIRFKLCFIGPSKDTVPHTLPSPLRIEPCKHFHIPSHFPHILV